MTLWCILWGAFPGGPVLGGPIGGPSPGVPWRSRSRGSIPGAPFLGGLIKGVPFKEILLGVLFWEVPLGVPLQESFGGPVPGGLFREVLAQLGGPIQGEPSGGPVLGGPVLRRPVLTTDRSLSTRRSRS